MANTVYGTFIAAAINSRWDEATENYEELHESQYRFASAVFEDLVRQHKNAELAEVVGRYASLNLDEPNKKTQTPLMVAFHVANVEAARILVKAGANVKALDGHSNTIQDYANWSKCRRSMEVAEAMLTRVNTSMKTESVRDILLAKRAQAKRPEPDFQ